MIRRSVAWGKRLGRDSREGLQRITRQLLRMMDKLGYLDFVDGVTGECIYQNLTQSYTLCEVSCISILLPYNCKIRTHMH